MGEKGLNDVRRNPRREWLEESPFEEEEEKEDGGIDFEAYEDIPVEVSGDRSPPQMESFDEYDLGNEVNANVKRCKYTKPTPVQKWAIPIFLHGRDLMACAQTGSGKTAAFGLPIVSGIVRSGERGMKVYSASCPLALILSPTRELATQIYQESRKFAYKTGKKPVVIYGGASVRDQLNEIRKGVELLIATPGRLQDFMNKYQISLQRCMYLVLDEADRMLDMGFEPQIRDIVEERDITPVGQRQTVMFSATFPDEIQRLASDFLSPDYLFISVGRVGSSTDLIQQHVEYVRPEEKCSYLFDLLQSVSGRTLVFVKTKKEADWLAEYLLRSGFSAVAIHGDRVQSERDAALKAFKRAESPIMVATDVASRGLDIPNVTHVINYDMPQAIDDYTHRIGRTGRAGKKGYATALFCEADIPLAPKLVELMHEANQHVPQWLLAYSQRQSSGPAKRRGGGGRFGGRDFRRDSGGGSPVVHSGGSGRGFFAPSRRNPNEPSPWD